MKRIILASVVFMSCVAVSMAREYPLNPDRFPSIGLSLSGQGSEGDLSIPSAPALGKQNASYSTGLLILDTRLPLSNSFTLDLAIGSLGETQETDATASLNSTKFEGNGGYFRIGARYYFNRGAKQGVE